MPLEAALKNSTGGRLHSLRDSQCAGIKSLGYLEFRTAGRIALRGNFRQVLRAEMILQTTWTRLKDAETPAACWQAVKTAAGELGFCRVRMELDDFEFSETLDDPDSGAAWTIRIPIEGRGYLELAHRFEQDVVALTVVPMTDLLHKCLRAESRRRSESVAEEIPEAVVALRKAVGA